jgi:hypothetical protein
LTGQTANNGTPSNTQTKPLTSQANQAAGQGQNEPPAVRQMEEDFEKPVPSSSSSRPNTCYGMSIGSPKFATNACFQSALGQAEIWKTEGTFTPPGTKIQGIRPLQSSNLLAPTKQIVDTLKRNFGGRAAVGNPSYTPAEIMAQKQGIPIPVTEARLKAIVSAGKNGDQWLVFIKETPADDGHVFNVRVANNTVEYWDSSALNAPGDQWFVLNLQEIYVYQLY